MQLNNQVGLPVATPPATQRLHSRLGRPRSPSNLSSLAYGVHGRKEGRTEGGKAIKVKAEPPAPAAAPRIYRRREFYARSFLPSSSLLRSLAPSLLYDFRSRLPRKDDDDTINNQTQLVHGRMRARRGRTRTDSEEIHEVGWAPTPSTMQVARIAAVANDVSCVFNAGGEKKKGNSEEDGTGRRRTPRGRRGFHRRIFLSS